MGVKNFFEDCLQKSKRKLEERDCYKIIVKFKDKQRELRKRKVRERREMCEVVSER